jgi:hypothetical protein
MFLTIVFQLFSSLMKIIRNSKNTMQDLINFQDNYVSFDFENKPGQKISNIRKRTWFVYVNHEK